ncbi:MAG: hypothetical protein E6I37_09450 [Chloroflexi bacterium]|nr:MAG: hypothetical protein E6I37_09450 [Chloroflexota bacterium]
MDKKEIRVTQEMIDEARRLGLTGSDLVMAAIKKAIERETIISLNEGVRFILPDGQVIETDESWPPPSATDGQDG